MKKILTIGLIGLTLFATGCGCNKKEGNGNSPTLEPDTGTVINTAEDVIKDQELDGLQMRNTALTVTNGVSTLITEITNNTGTDYNLVEFSVAIKGADGSVMYTFGGFIGDVTSGETKTISSSVDIDLSSATSIEYSVKK